MGLACRRPPACCRSCPGLWGLCHYRVNGFLPGVQGVFQVIGKKMQALTQPHMTKISSVHLLLEFIHRKARSDLLLERSSTACGILKPFHSYLVHFPANGCGEGWKNIH